MPDITLPRIPDITLPQNGTSLQFSINKVIDGLNREVLVPCSQVSTIKVLVPLWSQLVRTTIMVRFSQDQQPLTLQATV